MKKMGDAIITQIETGACLAPVLMLAIYIRNSDVIPLVDSAGQIARNNQGKFWLYI